jgi:hypothetical protein
MKKLLLIFCCIFPLSIFAQEISRSEAEIIAKNFYLEKYQLVKKEKPGKISFKKEQISLKSEQIKPLYIFNNETYNGFVIVSGNKAVYPVLAYSLEEEFNEAEIPSVVKEWLDIYKNKSNTLGS